MKMEDLLLVTNSEDISRVVDTLEKYNISDK